jgi:nitronate monooxygenase
MHNFQMPILRIGNIELSPPIIQGGMGVRVSGANLAAAVANEGCAGIIACVGLGDFEGRRRDEALKIHSDAVRASIRAAREKSNGVIGVNIMCALLDYELLVSIAVDEKVDLIISGAGLPLDLPKLVPDPSIKLLPIVSSARALKLICRRWRNKYSRLPDAVVVEGVKAGGHLGFSYEEVKDPTTPSLEEIVCDVIKIANSQEHPFPVIPAGGIFNGADIARFLKLGASGVQMGTRFVCTDECDVHENYKQTYLNAKKEDLCIIKSPVGLPGRVLRNDFVDAINAGATIPNKCSYRCLKTCDPKTTPYCIASVLIKAADGKLNESFAFAGTNAYRCEKIVSVRELIAELAEGLVQALG